MRPVISPFIALITTCLCGVAAPVSARVELTADLEYNVKAAYIFNLANFTTWPPSAFSAPVAPLRVCVASPDPFDGALAQVFNNEQVAGHPVAVVGIASPTEVPTCHVLFIGKGARDDNGLEKAASGAPVLTVGETDRFETSGGMIRFVIDGGRVRFDVNKGAAERAGLQLSSKVLQVARKVS